jgi:nicotinate-nucleotide adenylyltransferase
LNSSRINRIGIFSGSFDPPHKGHIHISKIFLKKLKLKKLIWTVSKKNPLLKKKYYYSYKERIILSKKISNNIKKISVSNYDKKYSYQFNTKKIQKL